MKTIKTCRMSRPQLCFGKYALMDDMASEAKIPFELSTFQVKALRSIAQDASDQLQSAELEWYKNVECKEIDLKSRSTRLAAMEESLQRQRAELERSKKALGEARNEFLLARRNFDYQMLQRGKHLQQQRVEFEEMQKKATVLLEGNKAIQIVVGNHKFKTFCNTLLRFPESTLAQCGNAVSCIESPKRKVFIDRDGLHFNFILNYLRGGNSEEHVLNQIDACKYSRNTIAEMLEEANYYNLKELVRILNWALIKRNSVHEMSYLISEGLFVSVSGGYATKEPRNGQVVNLSKRNFTGRRFDHVHFKHNTSFEGSVLEGAVFSHCKFEAPVSFTDGDLQIAEFVDCEFPEPINIIETGAANKDAALLAGARK